MLGKKDAATFEKLAELMSPENNSGLYRKKLNLSRGACVPYLGMFL
jgi:hypothetical protein